MSKIDLHFLVVGVFVRERPCILLQRRARPVRRVERYANRTSSVIRWKTTRQVGWSNKVGSNRLSILAEADQRRLFCAETASNHYDRLTTT
jgi:hypothetical protein